MNEIQQAQLQVLSLREELKSAEGRLAFLQGFAAGQKSHEDNAMAEKEAAERRAAREAEKAEAERQEKLRAAKASLAAVKANRTRRVAELRRKSEEARKEMEAEKAAEAEREKASLAAVKANRTRRKQKAETLTGAGDSGDDLVAGAEKEFKRRAAKSVFGLGGAGSARVVAAEAEAIAAAWEEREKAAGPFTPRTTED